MQDPQAIAMNRLPCGCVIAYNVFVVPNTNPIQINGSISCSHCPVHEHAEELFKAAKSACEGSMGDLHRSVEKIKSKG